MDASFLEFVQRLWLSAYFVQCVRAVLAAVLFELLYLLARGRLERALAGALAKDSQADSVLRMDRRRIVLGVPLFIVRATLFVIGLMVVLRIFRFRPDADVYPVLLGVLALALVAGREAMRDAVAGYFLSYDYVLPVGSMVQIGQYSGVVQEVGLRYTTLRTPEGTQVVLRNSRIQELMRRGQRSTGGARKAEPVVAPPEVEPGGSVEVTLLPPEAKGPGDQSS